MPDPITSHVATVKSILGETRGIGEFIQSFAQKSLGAVALGVGMCLFYGAASIEGNWQAGCWLFGGAVVQLMLFVLCESWKKVAALRVLEKRSISDDLTKALEKAVM